jgi:hypothetical protein
MSSQETPSTGRISSAAALKSSCGRRGARAGAGRGVGRARAARGPRLCSAAAAARGAARGRRGGWPPAPRRGGRRGRDRPRRGSAGAARLRRCAGRPAGPSMRGSKTGRGAGGAPLRAARAGKGARRRRCRPAPGPLQAPRQCGAQERTPRGPRARARPHLEPHRCCCLPRPPSADELASPRRGYGGCSSGARTTQWRAGPRGRGLGGEKAWSLPVGCPPNPAAPGAPTAFPLTPGTRNIAGTRLLHDQAQIMRGAVALALLALAAGAQAQQLVIRSAERKVRGRGSGGPRAARAGAARAARAPMARRRRRAGAVRPAPRPPRRARAGASARRRATAQAACGGPRPAAPPRSPRRAAPRPQINLKTQVAKVTDSIDFAVTGGGGDAKEVLFCYPGRLAARLARIKVRWGPAMELAAGAAAAVVAGPAGAGGGLQGRRRRGMARTDREAAESPPPPRPQVSVGKEKFDAAPAATPAGAPPGTACFSAPVPVKKGDKTNAEVSASFTDVMRPNPAKMGQDEQQLMEYEDTLWVLSPYKVEAQTTTVGGGGRGRGRQAAGRRRHAGQERLMGPPRARRPCPLLGLVPELLRLPLPFSVLPRRCCRRRRSSRTRPSRRASPAAARCCGRASAPPTPGRRRRCGCTSTTTSPSRRWGGAEQAEQRRLRVQRVFMCAGRGCRPPPSRAVRPAPRSARPHPPRPPTARPPLTTRSPRSCARSRCPTGATSTWRRSTRW